MIILIATKDVGQAHLWHFELKINTVSLLQVFGYIFSDEKDVVQLVSKVMPLVASFQVRLKEGLWLST